MLQQGEVDVGGVWVTFLDHPTDFLGLPINDAGHDDSQTITCIELGLNITGGYFALFAVSNLPSQGVHLFAF